MWEKDIVRRKELTIIIIIKCVWLKFTVKSLSKAKVIIFPRVAAAAGNAKHFISEKITQEIELKAKHLK